MTFKETRYGDISSLNSSQGDIIDISMTNLTSLEGCPPIVIGNFDCSKNNLILLEFAPKKIKGYFSCKENKEIKDAKQQIIKCQIEAKEYWTDEGYFSFEDIKKEFLKFEFLNKTVTSQGFRTLLGLDK